MIKLTNILLEFTSPAEDKDFYTQILNGIDAPVTDENLKFFAAWRQAEGGRASNNPFNTTYKLDADADKTDYNSAGVKNYTTKQYGIDATVKTLRLSYYKNIVKDLRDNAGADQIASNIDELKTWGTGGLVAKILKRGNVNAPGIGDSTVSKYNRKSIQGLQYGDRGSAVKEMQEALIYLDFSVGPMMNDGIFGPYTRQGVKDFQKANNLVVNGVYDESTKSALEEKTKEIPEQEIETKIMSLRKSKSSDGEKITSDIEYDRDDAKKWSQNVIDALDIAALDYSVPREILYTIANIESAGNPEAKNKKSGASGLFQIMPRYFTDYGVDKTTVWNPYINAEAAAKKMAKRMASINKIISSSDRDNIGAYIYMAHQQGLAGFQLVYTACSKYSNLNAEQALISAAADYNRSESFGRTVLRNMKANGPDTPCKFIKTWINKYDRNLRKIQKRMK
jgi:peptidoglycan hydrolase-like protein with peptidoglycan-binding domain